MLVRLYSMPVAANPIVWRKASVDDAMLIDMGELREQVRLPADETSQDNELRSLYKAAVAAIEVHCDYSIHMTTWDGYTSSDSGEIVLQKRPFDCMTRFVMMDSDGTEIVVPATDYLVTETALDEGVISLAKDSKWPEYAQRRDAVRFTVKAGHISPLPADLHQAILSLVAHYDTHRGDCDMGVNGIPATVRHLVTPYQNLGLCFT